MVDLTHIDWMQNCGGSIGMLPKAIIHKDGLKYYVKLSSYNKYHGVYGIESII